VQCARCGSETENEWSYCPFCGAAVGGRVGGAEPGQPMAVPHVPPPGPSRTLELAVGSIVLGSLGVFTLGLTSIAGLVMGVLAWRQATRGGRRAQGAGLAVAGVLVSALCLCLIAGTVALGIPRYMQYRDKVRGAQTMGACQSSLKQIGVALWLYAQDHEERFPPAGSWCDALEPHVPHELVFACPAMPGVRSGYAFNRGLDSLLPSQVRSPAEVVATFDAVGGWNLSGGAELAALRHRDGLNVGYADGHVRFRMELAPEDLSPARSQGAPAQGR